LLLAGLGGAAGVLFARWATPALCIANVKRRSAAEPECAIGRQGARIHGSRLNTYRNLVWPCAGFALHSVGSEPGAQTGRERRIGTEQVPTHGIGKITGRNSGGTGALAFRRCGLASPHP